MTQREAVEIILIARRTAKRIRQVFKIDHKKMSRFGFSDSEIREIEAAVARIEWFIEDELGALK